MEKILISCETQFYPERNSGVNFYAYFIILFRYVGAYLIENLRKVFVLSFLLLLGFSVTAQINPVKVTGQSNGQPVKKPVPSFEAAKIPSGLNFPQELEKVYGDEDYELGSEFDENGFLIQYTVADPTILRIEGNKAMILKAGETKVYAEISASQQILNTVPLEQTLKVHPGLLKITVVSGQKKKYGSPDPDFEFQASGFVYGDGHELFSGNIQRESGEDVGKYEIGIGDLTAGGNYQIGYTPSFFEITKRELTVEAKEAKKYYGADDPELEFSVNGFIEENVESILSGQPNRELGETVGNYVIGPGNLSVNPNYELVFQTAIFEIVPTELSTVFESSEIQTEWSVMPDLPKYVSALTKDGQILEIPVNWEKSTLNLMEKGTCYISGTLQIPAGVKNPDSIKPFQKLTVLAKPAPEDVFLNHLKFEPSSSEAIVEIGQFTVVDDLDDSHTISLVEGVLDNSNFQIDGFSLSWKQITNNPAKDHYSILVKVLDRAGNSLEKEFELKTEFSQFSSILIHNAFTPNNDGFNDTWGIPALANKNGIQIQVFDKYGNLLFAAKNPTDQWDGTFQGKTVPADTYFWVINSQVSGETRRGFLSLLRK